MREQERGPGSSGIHETRGDMNIDEGLKRVGLVAGIISVVLYGSITWWNHGGYRYTGREYDPVIKEIVDVVYWPDILLDFVGIPILIFVVVWGIFRSVRWVISGFQKSKE